MMNMKKKYLVFGLVAVLVVAALVCALVLGRGEEPQPTDPTEGTTENTQPGGETDPTEGTTESTQPGGETENTEATEGAGGTQVTEPDPTEADPTEPEATEPDATEPDETEPDETKPGKTEPAETEPEETEPEATEPNIWDGTGSSQPVETEPAETEPDSTEETYHVHDYDSYEIAPTCTEPGYKVFTCVICGHVSKDQRGSKLGHDWKDEWVVTREPTVGEPGEKQRTCSRCGTVTEAIPPLDESGEAYESYIDPRVTVKEYRTCVGYDYEKISVADFRTWGDPLSIWVNEDGSLTVVYYQQNGTRVEVLVEVPPENYVRACDITDDGAYRVHLIGGYGSNAP